jgi:UDP-N-acetylglucosamine--N-acetylmuramyl-(pentapeptide) pyrophosphoryl-undecaprenol N-acetylglucosamine transferase
VTRAVLAVCSGGGHLKELERLLPFVPEVGRVDWLTNEGGLAHGLEARCRSTRDRVFYAPHAAPRDIRTLLADAAVARTLLRSNRYDLALSTGGAIALTVLPLTRAHGIPSTYIESAARSVAPSTTGKLLQYVPGIRCFTQYRAYVGRRWSYVGSLFDEYEPGPLRPDVTVTRVLVTVGTLETYGFRRLVDRILAIADESWEVTWQLGSTSADGLPPDWTFTTMSEDAMVEAIRGADVVIAHAGVGTAMSAFDEGRCPVLVARRQAAGEHVDDHQQLIAGELSRRGLAVGVEVDDLDRAAILEAASRSVRRREAPLTLPI